MAQLNKKQVNKQVIVNRAGGKAYKLSDKEALATLLLTSFFSGGDTFYEKNAERKQRLSNLLANVDPTFAAKAAFVARDKFNMRTASHLVATNLAKESFPAKEKFFDKVVVRPDDMLEITAGVLGKANGGDGKLPAALKRGFANALTRFDEYQLAKYRGEGKEVNLYDLINLVHPKETPAIKKIMTGEFVAPATFEVKLTQAGQAAKGETEEEIAASKAENKKEAWRELVLGRKIGYFALLRNLRNIYEQGDEETQKAALELLVDEKLIKKSRVMPFRFMTAYGELQGLPSSVLTAIGKAFDIALKANVEPFKGKTLVVYDDSGSMGGCPIFSPRPSWATIAAAFCIAINKLDVDNTHLMRFSDTASYTNVDLGGSTLSIVKNVPFRSGGTNMHSVFQEAARHKHKYDRIIILSDMQSWYDGDTLVSRSLAEYKKVTGANPIVYSWDLQGYGDSALNPNDKNVVLLSGWMGDKVFELINIVEGGASKGLVDEIEKVEL